VAGLSLYRYQAGKYGDSIAAAKTALRLKPEDAEAWTNICGRLRRDEDVGPGDTGGARGAETPSRIPWGKRATWLGAEQQRRLEPQ